MKKTIFSMALLSMMCAAPVFSVDVMSHETMKEPVIQTAPATAEPKIDTIDKAADSTLKDMNKPVDSTFKGDKVQKLDNFGEPTDFVAPVDAE